MTNQEILATANEWLRKLAATYIHQKLIGNELIRYAPHYYESDGRARKRMVRVLWEENYTLDAAADDTHIITDKAYRQISAEKPNLCAIWDMNRQHYTNNAGVVIAGINLELHLTLAQQKYVIENASDYKLSLLDSRNVLFFAKKDEALPFRVGENDVWQLAQRANRDVAVYVEDADLLKHVEDFTFERELAYALGRNLGYTLIKLGIAPEEAKKTFANDDTPQPFTDSMFGTNPAKWAEEMQKRTSYLAESIAKRAAKLQQLIAAQQKIEAMGGWPRLLEEHVKLIREQLVQKRQISS